MQSLRFVSAGMLAFACAGFLRQPAPAKPEEAAKKVWDRLADQRSFSFTLRFHTNAPFDIAAEFKGTRDKTGREQWQGFWRRRGETSRVELLAAGADQYQREGKGWRRSSRGIEARVLEQIAAATEDNPLKYTGMDRGLYTYQFEPSIPILDPAQMKKLSGVVEIDTRTGLPVRIYCSDTGRSAEWELRLGRFNRAGPIRVPFVPALTVIAEPERRVACLVARRATKVLSDRLVELGWEHRLRMTCTGVELQLDRAPSNAILDLLLCEGRVELWSGAYVSDSSRTDTARVVVVGNDAARRAVLGQKLGVNGQIAARPDLELPMEPALAVSLIGYPLHHAVLLLDGRALSVSMSGHGREVEFKEVGSEDAVRVLAAIANHATMPVGYHVVTRR